MTAAPTPLPRTRLPPAPTPASTEAVALSHTPVISTYRVLCANPAVSITTAEVDPATTQVDRAKHKSTARVLDPPSPLPQVDGVVEPTSTPSTHTATVTSTYTFATSPATPSPASPSPPPRGRIWRHAARRTMTPKPHTMTPPAHLIPGIPGPGHPPWPWPTGPLDTCNLCGRHPAVTLDYTTPGWGGLCTSCTPRPGPLRLNLTPSQDTNDHI